MIYDMTKTIAKYLALCILFAFGGYSYADTPLSPPELLTFCSPSKKFCAVTDPIKNTTYVSSEQTKKTLWSIPGWHRWLIVSDDGESLVASYSGMNLIPIDASLDEPVLFFYASGKLIRKVTLADLYISKSQLKPTSSNLAWVRSINFNKSNQLVVELMSGKKVAFATTGLTEQILINEK